MSKILTALIASMLALSAFAADAPKPDDAKKQEMFTKMKQMRVDGIQGRISLLQTAATCVNAATNHDQMKACSEKEHQAMEAFHKEQKAKRESLKPQK
jgi:hypothetical protein